MYAIRSYYVDFLPTGALTGGLDYTQYFAEKKYMLKAVSYNFV